MNKNKSKNTIRYYNKLSGKYDSSYRAYLKHTHDMMMGKLKTSKNERILDVSCGTGILASQMIQFALPFKSLVLNEPSDGMIEKAMQRIPDSERIEFTGHLAEELPFGDESFDRIICLNSFHYYVDQQKVLEHFSRLLKPGGTFYILDWNLEGWFHIPNFIIKTLSPENINTRSLDWQMKSLPDYGFEILYSKRWAYRYWKFYLVEAVLRSQSGI